MRRNLYLTNEDLDSAKSRYLEVFGDVKPKKERIKTIEALDRYLAGAVFAKYSCPSYNASAMDGIATLSIKTLKASEREPVILKRDEDYIEIDTGDMLKKPYDAVIMAEDLIECPEGYKIIQPSSPFSNVRTIGEDITQKEMVLTSFKKLTPIDISVLLASGNGEVEVISKVRVGIIPTGDEMIDYDKELTDDKIIDTNSYLFSGLVKQNYGIPKRYPIVKDDLEAIKAALLKAVKENDIVIINAGSSAGRDDLTPIAIRELGEVYTHGVLIKPGKPVVLGKIAATPVIGLPGYPVSSYITFCEFVLPLMERFVRVLHPANLKVKATLTKTIMSSLKYREYVRVKLGIVAKRLIATPLKGGAGASMSLVRADGFCIIPKSSEGILEDQEVEVTLTKDLENIEKTLVITGSHDLILDIIKDEMIEKSLDTDVASTHVGSLSGLITLKKRQCHLAPSHLLDTASASYNIPIVKEIFAGEKMAIIKGVERVQGIMVQKGNPLNIKGIRDLIGKVYINRQKGAGTRVLFDHLLKEEGISKDEINGYDHEVATHMAVAIAIKNGDAQCGMGTYSAARDLDLDFIAIRGEEYDFVTYAAFLSDVKIQRFIEVLKSPSFKKRLDDLGGYAYKRSGEVILL